MIAVIGLGYVGLPLAVALSKNFSVTGFDIEAKRIEELKNGQDRTGEIEPDILETSSLICTDQFEQIKNFDTYIITVPTPIDETTKKPDLTALKAASKTVGIAMSKGALIVYESTVYPGVTEDICGPVLEEFSGLKAGKDFFLGYSPERINPGDKEHTVDRITKVIAAQTPETVKKMQKIYGSINQDNLFTAKNIKTAEAAKVIENAQRDINIAFMNEITSIFGRLNISVYDVLDAANTKWNFLNFTPGLVGGHCIGVDPYYLSYCAEQEGHRPNVILSGRRTNENMASYIAEEISSQIPASSKILMLGLTFKENIPDLRNTKIVDLVQALKKKGHHVTVHDPFADPLEAESYYKIDLLPSLEQAEHYDALIGGVAHQPYLSFTEETFLNLVKTDGLVADIKGMWRHQTLPKPLRYWCL